MVIEKRFPRGGAIPLKTKKSENEVNIRKKHVYFNF